MTCPICSNPAMRDEIDVCPICGAPGARPEIDALAIEFIEWCLDRAEDERVFGTKVTVQ
jgi:hypothetical protein